MMLSKTLKFQTIVINGVSYRLQDPEAYYKKTLNPKIIIGLKASKELNSNDSAFGMISLTNYVFL